MTHVDSIEVLPRGAEVLAATEVEPHAAVRFGDRAWGLQFHPEFDVRIMTDYVQARADICWLGKARIPRQCSPTSRWLASETWPCADSSNAESWLTRVAPGRKGSARGVGSRRFEGKGGITFNESANWVEPAQYPETRRNVSGCASALEIEQSSEAR